jgi:hypothetical protein
MVEERDNLAASLVDWLCDKVAVLGKDSSLRPMNPTAGSCFALRW